MMRVLIWLMKTHIPAALEDRLWYIYLSLQGTVTKHCSAAEVVMIIE